ncbi:MAG: hypothetical protein ACU0FH_15640 [Heliomarina sp.]|uniref:hypothetical protein n=1 Tax=Heliomarina sp. TaxID=2917556 RepID=UPI0040583A02
MAEEQVTPEQSICGADQVRHRHVFYIPGYDPIHPRRYRELYRKEGAAQAAISGYELSLSPKQMGGAYGWHVAANIEGAAVSADVEVLVWSDIVRDSMTGSIPGTYLQLARTAWIYISTGALWRMMRLRKGPVIAALYPVGFLLVQALVAVLTGLGVFYLIAPYAGVLAALPALLVARLILRWFKKRDGRYFAYYLMHDYAFSARWHGANPAELEERIAEMGNTIAEALQGGAEEVLVVGHSSGAHLAVSILADLLRAGRVPYNGPALSFLSLGHVVPMMSFLPAADRLRRDLRDLSASERVTWVDVTAPGDGCAFALCDPVAVSGVAPPGRRGPLVISAAFTQTLSPERWRELRWRFFRLHFQYLCAFDRPGDYDYFRITAGPQRLATRFAGRAPSASRIETPVSGYRSVSGP